MEFAPIGTIHTPFSEHEGTPIQPGGGVGVAGTVELFEEYRDGLGDLSGFSHIILLFHFHRSQGYKLRVVPYMDNEERGVFATRAPRRPNPIGLSVVRLERIEAGRILHIRDVDMLDGTPLLDIKPYVPEFEPGAVVSTGWLAEVGRTVSKRRADGRFEIGQEEQ